MPGRWCVWRGSGGSCWCWGRPFETLGEFLPPAASESAARDARAASPRILLTQSVDVPVRGGGRGYYHAGPKFIFVLADMVNCRICRCQDPWMSSSYLHAYNAQLSSQTTISRPVLLGCVDVVLAVATLQLPVSQPSRERQLAGESVYPCEFDSA
jgi:hypothetical protein